MKKIRSTSPLRTVLLFVLAASLLAVGGIGTVRAAPAVSSEYYSSDVELYDIGVVLIENGTAVGENLLSSLVPADQDFHMGQTYQEVLSVRNSGNIDEFVRVTIYKYWLDKDGNKVTTLTPDMIDLHILTGNGWVEDPETAKLQNAERTVLYYTSVVPVGESTKPFADTLTVNGVLPYLVTQSTEGNVITTTYDYDNVSFQIEVQVDAVQTHNAEAAIKSAWGRTVSVSGSNLSLA